MQESPRAKILIVDDEEPIRDVLSASLMDEGYEVLSASNGEEGVEKIKNDAPDVVFLDIWMPGALDGLGVLKECQQIDFAGDFLVMSGHGTIETAVKATKFGAWDFIEKPLSIDKITILLSNLLAFQHEKRAKQSLLNKLRQSFSLIGQSEVSLKLKENISRLCASQQALLLSGEMGVGKSLVAQHIHYFSMRASQPFIDINCTAQSPDLIEADIFGYQAGFFTGTSEDKAGKLEVANGGTLLLKEVESLDIKVQDALLNYLKDHSIKRLGSDRSIPVNTRLILASAANLATLVEEGKFSKDLYHYLQDLHLEIPPLRERKDDLLELVEHFNRFFEKEGDYRPKVYKEDALSRLKEHNWPGNIRELKNFIERVFILCETSKIGAQEVNYIGIGNREDDVDRMFDENSTLRDARSQFEKEFILKKLEENDGNISKTAEVIGVERSHLHRKIKSFGIDV